MYLGKYHDRYVKNLLEKGRCKYLIFDCDEVIRDFSGVVFGEYPSKWGKFTEAYQNKVDSDPEKYLINNRVYTNIVNYINNYCGDYPVIIMTNQFGVPSREEATRKFLSKHIKVNYNIIFVSSFEEKLNLIKNNNVILLDDYPNYITETDEFNKVYRDKIVLMPQPHNEDIEDRYRYIFDYSKVIVKDKDLNKEIEFAKIIFN